MVVKSRWRATRSTNDVGSCCWPVTTYPSVAVCRALPAVVGKSTVGLNNFLWQRRRSLVGTSQGHPQFTALTECHVQKDNAIFEHFASQIVLWDIPRWIQWQISVAQNNGPRRSYAAGAGIHAVGQQPMCCDLCVHGQCKCLHFCRKLATGINRSWSSMQSHLWNYIDCEKKCRHQKNTVFGKGLCVFG